MMAKYDARNPAALKKLVAGGAQLRPYPQDVMEACFKAANETLREKAATNAAFKKVYDAMVAFRADQFLWFRRSSEAHLRHLHDGPQRKKLLYSLITEYKKGASRGALFRLRTAD